MKASFKFDYDFCIVRNVFIYFALISLQQFMHAEIVWIVLARLLLKIRLRAEQPVKTEFIYIQYINPKQSIHPLFYTVHIWKLS